MVGFTVLVLIALVNGGTAKISVLTFTMPIWANILAYIFLKEKLALSQWLAILISAFGLMMIFDPIHVLSDFNSMAIAILSGFFWACGAILFKRYNSKYPNSDLLNLTAWQMLLGCIPIVLYILFKGIEIYEVNNYLFGASLYNAFFCNAVAWILWLYGVKHLKTSTVSILSLLAPVIGSLAAFIELGETPLTNELIGLVLILGGIAFMMILGLRSTSR
jgi:drug/metabolite transporter (DMT)-like permease